MTRNPGVPQSMGLQRAGHDLATEQQRQNCHQKVLQTGWVKQSQ